MNNLVETIFGATGCGLMMYLTSISNCWYCIVFSKPALRPRSKYLSGRNNYGINEATKLAYAFAKPCDSFAFIMVKKKLYMLKCI